MLHAFLELEKSQIQEEIVVSIDKYSQAYGETVSCFRHLGKDNILQPYFTQKDFLTSNVNP